VNPRPAHLFMICSNIKLTGPAESIAIDALRIHEWNQRDLAMAVQRKLEIPEDANRARGIPRKALPFIVPGRPHLLDGTRLRKGSSRRPCNWDLGLDRRRHCEKPSIFRHAEAWIASAFAGRVMADKSLRVCACGLNSGNPAAVISGEI
jgi:hypothetical protein